MARKPKAGELIQILDAEDVKLIEWSHPELYDFSVAPEIVRRVLVGAFVGQAYEHYRHDHVKKYSRTVTQNNYATNILGIDPVAFSLIKNGYKLPSVEQADVMSKFYGPVIWDVCGYSRRMPLDKLLYAIADLWPKLSDKAQNELIERARNLYDNGEVKNDKEVLDTDN